MLTVTQKNRKILDTMASNLYSRLRCLAAILNAHVSDALFVWWKDGESIEPRSLSNLLVTYQTTSMFKFVCKVLELPKKYAKFNSQARV